ncbi:adenylyl-sulfate kinase [Pontibacillus yanchengensis]|uniref:Adenylyl-sulfate kinase n=2 Tax=Pontibacillus yanchengensis TaxID=462910 RepID=A0A6I4ZWD0_9BACI|nr:adenylyl-sulfate kinase [Pontibacillus yanchengensis]MYL34505.1 adenylyl-sulfate kinase [Pontibacillus yanchengensis]MYL54313.1 adenylyl-sulfate kinase [Pontibacillus yanchengensis]
MSEERNLTWHASTITKDLRHRKNEHKSAILWFTGLSGAGKSSIANAVSLKLFDESIQHFVLDGDNVRHGLNKDLGFSEEDRKENIRRIGEVAKLFIDSGQFAITAFISPFQEDRNDVRELVEEDEFIEIHVKCSLAECEKRDPKGLYKKVKQGEIKNFTGIDSPYEAPESPEIVVDAENDSVEACSDQIIAYLREQQYI